MGLRLRKSINLGGFRINISKSGVGYSFGVPGMRFTKKARGGFRTTTSIPGTGISYVRDSKQKIRNNKSISNDNNQYIGQRSYSEVVISSSHQLVDKMNEATKKNKVLLVIKKLFKNIACFGFAFFICYILGIFQFLVGIVSLIIAIAASLVFLLMPKSALIELDYVFDNCEDKTNYYNVTSAIDNLKNTQGLWEINSLKTHNDWKNNAGTNSSINRAIIKICDVKLFKSNFSIQSINVQDKKIIFLPDIIAVQQNEKWFAVKWEEFKSDMNSIIFVESGRIPNDTVITGYSYLHPNKNGGPDKRYVNNPRLAKCLYSLIGLKSTNGLRVVLMMSSKNIAQTLFKTLSEYRFNNLFE